MGFTSASVTNEELVDEDPPQDEIMGKDDSAAASEIRRKILPQDGSIENEDSPTFPAEDVVSVQTGANTPASVTYDELKDEDAPQDGFFENEDSTNDEGLPEILAVFKIVFLKLPETTKHKRLALSLSVCICLSVRPCARSCGWVL